MRRGWLGLGLVVLGVLASGQTHAGPGAPTSALSKLDATARMELLSSRAKTVSMYVKTDDVARTTAEVKRLGGSVGTVSGDILTVRLPKPAITTLAGLASVSRVEGARRVLRRLDRARVETKVEQVHAGAAGTAYKGAGVIVGVVDYALDLGHDAFKKPDGSSRVIGLWDQGLQGTPPQGYTYGAECNAAAIAGGTCAHAATDSHGTHVTGIAAGAPIAGVPYGGMAPEADIAFVHLSNKPGVADENEALTTSICDAAAYIFKLAAAQGKPAVVNMSLGEHSGSHDGTSLADQCLDNLTGPGKIIVAAAGNEGQGSQSPKAGNPAVAVHAGGTASGTPTTVRFLPSSNMNQVSVDLAVWFDTPNDVSVRIGADDGQGNIAFTPAITRAQALNASTLTVGALTLGPLQAAGGELPSGARGIQVRIVDQDQNSEELNSVEWILEVTGAGRFDAFIDTTNGGGFIQNAIGAGVTADNTMTIGYPAIADKVLAVGSFVSRNAWTPVGGAEQQQMDNGGQQVVVGALSGFSSRGPARRATVVKQVPDIAAPGEIVTSVLNSRSTPNPLRTIKAAPNGYIVEEGTSMASPAVAGIVALMLQKNAQLTVDDVRRILTTSAVAPAGETLPNTNWGAGKVDALAALQAVTPGTPGGDAGTPGGDGGTGGPGSDAGTTPGAAPAASDSGCSCRTTPTTGGWVYAAVGALAVGLAAARRRKRK